MDKSDVLVVAHDVALAAWFGGSWMGAVGLNGATIEVDDHTQRTRVANAGWFRWSPIVAICVPVHVGSAAALGRTAPSLGDPGGTAVPLRRLRSAVTVAAAVATAVTGVAGRRVVRGGDVPVATAVKPISATPEDVARAQRVLHLAQWLVPVFTGALWAINAVQRDGRRSP